MDGPSKYSIWFVGKSAVVGELSLDETVDFCPAGWVILKKSKALFWFYFIDIYIYIYIFFFFCLFVFFCFFLLCFVECVKCNVILEKLV